MEDMDRLYTEVFGTSEARTDLPPRDADEQALQAWPRSKHQWQQQLQVWVAQVRDWWRTGRDQVQTFPRMPQMPQPLSLAYRVDRSQRVVPIDLTHVNNSLQQFDRVVSEIEASVARESTGQQLTQTWNPNPRDETCTVCDFRTFCPAPGNRYRGAPSAP